MCELVSRHLSANWTARADQSAQSTGPRCTLDAPALTVVTSAALGADLGFPLGFRGSSDIPGTKEGVSYLNNHLLLTIKYHKDEVCVPAHRLP